MQIDSGQRHQIASGGNALRTLSRIGHFRSVTMVRIWIASLHQNKGEAEASPLFWSAWNRTYQNATPQWGVADTSANTGVFNNFLHRRKCKSIPVSDTPLCLKICNKMIADRSDFLPVYRI